MSDWNDNIKPIAAKLHAELLKTHGEQTGALVEALEIARRQSEIAQTIKDWVGRHRFATGPDQASIGFELLTDAAGIFKSLCEEFGAQRAVHILTGLERQQQRARHGADLRAWRLRGNLTVAQAAAELGLAVEDVEAIEGETLNAGPAAMRMIRPALRRVASDLSGGRMAEDRGQMAEDRKAGTGLREFR